MPRPGPILPALAQNVSNFTSQIDILVLDFSIFRSKKERWFE